MGGTQNGWSQARGGQLELSCMLTTTPPETARSQILETREKGASWEGRERGGSRCGGVGLLFWSRAERFPGAQEQRLSGEISDPRPGGSGKGALGWRTAATGRERKPTVQAREGG